MSKYGEPWTHIVLNAAFRYLWTIKLSNENEARKLDEMPPSYHARIVSCVNACTDMEEPGKEIERLRKIEAAAIKSTDLYRAWYWLPSEDEGGDDEEVARAKNKAFHSLKELQDAINAEGK
jgi:hypothetical protein